MRFSILIYDGDNPACIGDVETNTIQFPDMIAEDAIEACSMLIKQHVSFCVSPREEA